MRELISFQCEQCKRRNYTSTKNKKTTTDKLALREVLPVVSRAYAPQGGQGLNSAGIARWPSVRRAVGSVALIGRAPDSKSGVAGSSPAWPASYIAERYTHGASGTDHLRYATSYRAPSIFSRRVWSELKKVHWPVEKRDVRGHGRRARHRELVVGFYLGMRRLSACPRVIQVDPELSVDMAKNWYVVHTYSGYEHEGESGARGTDPRARQAGRCSATSSCPRRRWSSS